MYCKLLQFSGNGLKTFKFHQNVEIIKLWSMMSTSQCFWSHTLAVYNYTITTGSITLRPESQKKNELGNRYGVMISISNNIQHNWLWLLVTKRHWMAKFSIGAHKKFTIQLNLTPITTHILHNKIASKAEPS